jgi:hypothetical protein
VHASALLLPQQRQDATKCGKAHLRLCVDAEQRGALVARGHGANHGKHLLVVHAGVAKRDGKVTGGDGALHVTVGPLLQGAGAAAEDVGELGRDGPRC